MKSKILYRDIHMSLTRLLPRLFSAVKTFLPAKPSIVAKPSLPAFSHMPQRAATTSNLKTIFSTARIHQRTLANTFSMRAIPLHVIAWQVAGLRAPLPYANYYSYSKSEEEVNRILHDGPCEKSYKKSCVVAESVRRVEQKRNPVKNLFEQVKAELIKQLQVASKSDPQFRGSLEDLAYKIHLCKNENDIVHVMRGKTSEKDDASYVLRVALEMSEDAFERMFDIDDCEDMEWDEIARVAMRSHEEISNRLRR